MFVSRHGLLIIELRSSASEACDLNNWAISPAQLLFLKKIMIRILKDKRLKNYIFEYLIFLALQEGYRQLLLVSCMLIILI